MPKKITQPKTQKHTIKEKIWGKIIQDDFRWLEDIQNREVKAWMRVQDRYARSILDTLPAKATLQKDFKKIFDTDDMTVPIVRGNTYFYRRKKRGEDQPSVYMRKGKKETLLLNPKRFSKDGSAVITRYGVSRDGKYIMFALSAAGNDKSDIRVMDVSTRKMLKDYIPAERHPRAMMFNADSSGFWYLAKALETPKGEEKLHRKIFFHRLGTKWTDDKIFFGENTAKEDWPTMTLSDTGRHVAVRLMIGSEKVERHEVYIHDLEKPEQGFVPVITKKSGYFTPEIYGADLYILTNHKAPNGRILKISLEDAFAGKGSKALREIIPESKEAISEIAVLGGKIILNSLKNAVSELKIYSLDGRYIKTVEFDTVGLVYNLRYEKSDKKLFFAFSSHTVPMIIYNLHTKSDTLTVFHKATNIIKPSQYITKQIWAISKDDTKVPMFVTHKKDLNMNGTNPTLVYGYGGFNTNTIPYYKKRFIPFLAAGGVYVDTCLRGGEEFGERWHKAGSQLNKKHVFEDFVACIEYLQKHKYTSPEKTAIFGWSNGGLLTSYIAT